MGVLDYVLVPLGLGLMVAYHLWLLYMVVKHPTKTVIGINSVNRRAWVHTMMEVTPLSPSTLICMYACREILVEHIRFINEPPERI